MTGISEKVFDTAPIARSKVYAITEQTTGQRRSSAWNNPADHFSTLRTYSAAASYVTGSHSFRFGGTMSEGPRRTVERYTGDLTMTFNNGVPQSVTLRTPLDQREGIKADVGLFAQDKWTINRATINAGLRFDWFQGDVLDEDLPAGRWSPAAHFDGFDVQNWKDLSPRLGVAYDLFGDGKTAVKFSVARYVNGEAAGTAAANNPQTTVGRTDTRTWTDPTATSRSSMPTARCRTRSSARRPTPTSASSCRRRRPRTRRCSTDGACGTNNWEYTASVQHELMPRVAVTAGYYRRSFGNQTAIDNQLATDAPFDGPFCITAPSNADLPGGGGYQVCGLYDIKPHLAGAGAQHPDAGQRTSAASRMSSPGSTSTSTRACAPGRSCSGGINAQKRHYNTCDTPLAAAVPGSWSRRSVREASRPTARSAGSAIRRSRSDPT